MIKPKYPKHADVSQVARLVVEHAIGGPLTRHSANDDNDEQAEARPPKIKQRPSRKHKSA